MLSLLQPIVIYLREQILHAQSWPRIIVDGYYYKLLAKCRLLGLVDELIFASWRRCPRPALVIYLDASPETAWRRGRESNSFNAFEHYGPRLDRESFERFQRDLSAALLTETAQLSVQMIRGEGDRENIVGEIENLIRVWNER